MGLCRRHSAETCVAWWALEEGYNDRAIGVELVARLFVFSAKSLDES